jgi:hypothetical protein
VVSLKTVHMLRGPTTPAHLALARRIDGAVGASIGGRQPRQNTMTRAMDRSGQGWPRSSHPTPQAQESCWL